MKWLKRILLALTGTGIALAAPVVPQEMRWLQSYETVAFETSDGDLALNEYAVKDEDEWYVRTSPKSRAGFHATTSADAIAGKKEVFIRCERCAYYSEFVSGKGEIVRVPFEGNYDDLRHVKDAPQPRRLELVNALAAQQGAAAIAFDAVSGTSNTTAVTSLSWSHTSAASAVLFIGYMAEEACGSTDATSVTYNGDALTNVVNYNNVEEQCVEIWVDSAPESGSHTAVINIEGGGANDPNGISMSYTGADTSSPTGASNTCLNPGASACDISVTTTRDNSWLVSFANTSDAGVGDVSVDAPAVTRREVDAGASIQASADRETGAIGTYSFGWNNNSDPSAAAAIELKEAAAGGTPAPTDTLILFE
jgi:hypothetical protein